MPNCRVCGKALVFANGLYCSNKCYRIHLERAVQQPVSEPIVPEEPAPSEPTAPPHSRDNREQELTPASEPPEPPKPPELSVNVVPLVITRRAAKQCRATTERIQIILTDIALGLNETEACAVSGINPRTWLRWKRMSRAFPTLSAHAAGIRKKELLKRKVLLADAKLDWKEAAWDLERRFREEFADPAKAPLALQQHNTFLISREKVREIEVMRAELLPEVDARLGLTDAKKEKD